MARKSCTCILFISLFIIYSVYPVSAAAFNKAALKSETAILIDGDTGQVLFEKEMHRRMYPASITKIMTALLALERGNPDGIITMSHEAISSIARGSSHIALVPGEELTLEQALYALALPSANDAANGIAEYIGGSMENFSVLMNERAGEAGALRTNFVNAHGLYDANHYTTAYDMARITLAAIQTPAFTEIFGSLIYEMPPTNKQPQARTLRCTNLIKRGRYKYEGVIAAKTGWIRQAGHTLVTVAERDGRTLISVVMKSGGTRDRWEDTTALLDYGFAGFTEVSFTAEELSRGNILSDTGFHCLIPTGLTKEDVEVTYITQSGAAGGSSAKAVFTLKSADIAQLGELDVRVLLPANAGAAVQKKNRAGRSVDRASMAPWVLGAAVLLLLCPVLLLFAKKRKKRRSRRRPNGSIVIRLNQTPAGYALHGGKRRRR